MFHKTEIISLINDDGYSISNKKLIDDTIDKMISDLEFEKDTKIKLRSVAYASYPLGSGINLCITVIGDADGQSNTLRG